MRERTVKRYYCDFCKKAGLSKYHMAKHEKHCTMNPGRECRMCVFLNGCNAEPMSELLAMLPEYPVFNFTSDPVFIEFEQGIKTAIPLLRDKVENCPSCIMAALRQKGIPVPAVDDFNFTAECKSIFDDANDERNERSYY